jgi:GntR family transcriptional regulator, galactonate operon transcriptional repressor
LYSSRLYPSGALHGQVAHEIGRQIVSGSIAEAALLPREAELSDRYRVSRQAIREALKVLAAKGLVTTRRRTGTAVAPRRHWNLLDADVLAWHGAAGLSPEFLGDLIELRYLIEPPAAALAAKRGTPEQLAQIGAALEEMSSNTHSLAAFYAGDVAFHAASFAASGNSLINRLSNIIAPLLQAAFRLQGATKPSLEDAAKRHSAVYQAMVARDPDAARQAMEAVLVASAKEVAEIRRQGEANGAEHGRTRSLSDSQDPSAVPDPLYPSASRHGRVAHEIGRQIVAGSIQEGDTLRREAELGAQYGVSRQAVREALKVLAAKGLVQTRRRAGSVVPPRRTWHLFDPDVLAWHTAPAKLPPDFLADLIELRGLIEPGAAAMAAGRGKPQRIARIGAALQAMHESKGEREQLYAADAAFHVAIFYASSNVLIERLSWILAPLLEASFHEQGNLAPTLDAAIAFHDAIYQAIARGDPNGARQSMENMLGAADSGISRLRAGEAKPVHPV